MKPFPFCSIAFLLYGLLAPNVLCCAQVAQPRTGHIKLANIRMLDAILAVAKDLNSPLGIMCADERLRDSEITVDIDGMTAIDAFHAVTASQPDLRTTSLGGVVFVQRTPLPSYCSFLVLKVPAFDAERDTVQHLSAKLWMTLEMQLDPKRTGFMGVLHPNAKDKSIGPARLKGEQVKDILNWMVKQHGAAAWVGLPTTDVKKASAEELWHIVFYDPPD